MAVAEAAADGRPRTRLALSAVLLPLLLLGRFDRPFDDRRIRSATTVTIIITNIIIPSAAGPPSIVVATTTGIAVANATGNVVVATIIASSSGRTPSFLEEGRERTLAFVVVPHPRHVPNGLADPVLDDVPDPGHHLVQHLLLCEQVAAAA